MYDKQYGFTKGRSNADIRRVLLKNNYETWVESQEALGILWNMFKVFDCIQDCTLVM